MRFRRATAAALTVVTASALLTACSGSDSSNGGNGGGSTTSATGPDATSDPSPNPAAGALQLGDVPTDLDPAMSEPAEDSYYPQVGNPVVDSLHYNLGLSWDPGTDTLYGVEELTFRAAQDADSFELDFGAALEVTAARLDGVEVATTHDVDDLMINAPVTEDQQYTLELLYRGTPEPVRAPTTRTDLLTTGFTIDADHQVWTMQEPYGAYSWYAVNDQPADKAYYDFTLHVPSPWTGIANGTQVLDDDDGAVHTTQFDATDPIASYLVTLAFGDYDKAEDTSSSGVPITYWTPRGDTSFDEGLHTAPAAIDWLENLLGPYPFDTAGIVVVDSESGMETQTMITLGNTSYSTSPEVVVHELAHQWYGDQVTPNDWRDVWMNEGMAMYLQLMWEAEDLGADLNDYLASYAADERAYRAQAGPPADYDPTEFGSSNIYFSGAFFWHAVRAKVGDDAFFKAMREWPVSQENESTDRETLLQFLEENTGRQLDNIWNSWLLGDVSPRLPGVTN